MKQFISLLLFACVLLASCGSDGTGSKPDMQFDVSVPSPQLSESKPNILFDEAHNNAHHLNNTYKPFAQLIKHDGCEVTATDKPITAELLRGTDIYITGCAHGEVDPGDACPYTASEVEALTNWVRNGGSLLVIPEHYPFGIAMTPLLEAFAVTVHNGYTEDSLLINPAEPDALLFQKANGSLAASHPITEHIDRVNTFTGTSVKGDSSYIPLLILSNHALNYDVTVTTVEKDGDKVTTVGYSTPHPASGFVQGICGNFGSGKIVILTDAAMITAQTDKRGMKFGMNIPNTDNKQFVLNMIRWLAAK